MTGEKFERLTVLSMEKDYKCRCLCECGTEVLVNKSDLKRGFTRSCGCLHREITSKRSRTHGLSGTTLYHVWAGMVSRCSSTAHVDNRVIYFDRGIRVCPEWREDPTSFIPWALANGYEKGLQIDRIDNNGNYEPTNCRFVTPLVNTHNQRSLRSDNNTGYAGVSFIQSRRKFQSRIYSGKQINLGLFKTAWEACQARNKFIVENNLPHRLQEEIK